MIPSIEHSCEKGISDAKYHTQKYSCKNFHEVSFKSEVLHSLRPEDCEIFNCLLDNNPFMARNIICLDDGQC